MKFERIVFVIFLLSLVVLFFLVDYLDKPYEGIIKSIGYFEGKVVINLESGDLLVIFGSNILGLKKGDEILFWGKKEVYSGEEQIIVEKIEKILEG